MKRALITGINGQDGSYLAELLLGKGYEVHGTVRPEALADPARLHNLADVRDRVRLHAASLDDEASLRNAVSSSSPDECYHLAAYSFVSYSYEQDASTLHANVMSTHVLLDALRASVPSCRFYFAGSSEMFGDPERSPQNEQTPFRPRSAYGVSKTAGYHLMRIARDGHGLHASCGLLFNHESPRRGPAFVTRKVSLHAARAKLGERAKLKLGNLDARRDWGDARDYVLAVWLMLQQDRPSDYVISTGETRTVRDLLDAAFGAAGLDYRDHVEVDAALLRPESSVPLVGDSSKAAAVLGWRSGTGFSSLIRDMVEADVRRLSPSPSVLR